MEKKVALKARFIPRNPHKYVGNCNNIMARSSWELKFFMFLDNSNAVLKWCSEEFSIPYIKPTDGRVHQYFPDVFVIYLDKEGNQHKEIIEIKPLKETILTERSTQHDKMAYIINQAKWEAARAFALSKGAIFRVATEVELFGGKAPTPKRKSAPRKKK